MLPLLTRLWRDQHGFVVSTELVLLGTILLLGSIVGLVTLRDQVVQELGDVGAAVGNLDHGYHVKGFKHGDCFVAGSSFRDKSDFCEMGKYEGSHNGDKPGKSPAGMDVTRPPKGRE